MKTLIFFFLSIALIADAAMIVGGKDLSYDSSQASMIVYINSPDGLGRPQTCTGTFISNEYVLTAAHCISDDFNSMSMNFRIKSFNKTREVRDLEITEVHKFNTVGVQRNDLGVIRFRGGLPPGARIALLPNSQKIKPKAMDFTAIGYGVTTGIASQDPMNQNGIDELRFKNMRSNIISSDQDTFRVDQNKNNGGVCSGDSGGPALVKNTIIGVASAIIKNDKILDKCKNESLYMNLYFYADIIRAKIH